MEVYGIKVEGLYSPQMDQNKGMGLTISYTTEEMKGYQARDCEMADYIFRLRPRLTRSR